MTEERKGEVTMKGNPVDLAGPRLSIGDQAPNFTCVGDGLNLVRLADTPAKPRMFSVVPSLDTPVCSTQTKRFAQEIASLGDAVAAYTVSLDLPFAQKRFCAEADIKCLTNVSDTHDHSFGKNYGVLITSLPMPLLCRAIFVTDARGTLTHVEYVPEITSEPDYQMAIAALKEAIS
jgi:thiol peroxidase